MIFATPFAVTISAEGLAGFEQKISAAIMARAGGDTEIAIVAGGARGAIKNKLIAKAQANQRRDPFYLNKRAAQLIKAAAPGLFSTFANIRRVVGEQVGNIMLININENVDAMKNADGSKFKALSPGYAIRKQREHGRIYPILRATGDFIGGLRVRVTSK